MHRSAFLGLVLALAATGCRTTTTSRMPGPESVEITQAAAARAWELWSSGRYLGAVVRFEVRDDTHRFFYSVRNREGQEMGIVDLHGRAYRYRAHVTDPEWLGTGPVFDGARKILDGPTSAEAVEVDVSRLQEILGKRDETAAEHPE